ncbi:MAG: glycosyl transferase [Polaromonas sp.]|nr:glycosyl transferase [Polaromonas sp.]
MKFSVLMSVYIKEKPVYLDECLASLGAQSLLPSEIVIVQDGDITDELKNVIYKYSEILPIKCVKLVENRGLAEALNEGLRHCSNELVARMDTDDVSLPHRFERQIAFMLAHPDVDVSSAWVEERDERMDTILFVKKLPSAHADIVKFSKKRNPISHPVSVFRKTAVMSVGAYPKIFPEDYALWSLMLVKGHRFGNIPETLLYMRTGADFMGRRGLNFFKGELGLLSYQRSIGFLNHHEFFVNFLIRAVIRLPPAKVRAIFYKFAR